MIQGLRPLLLAAIGIGIFAASLIPATAQDWPTRPIHIVVGAGAAGGTDITARIVAQPLSEILGQPVVVENRPGAGGTTAANAVAKAAKDGYTALMMSNAHAVAPVIYRSLPYDAVKDFQMISMVATAGLMLVVRPDFPAKDLKELIAALKASPGKYNYASPGVGTTQHFAAELFKQMTGVNVVHIPYRGTPAAISALRGNQVDLLFELIQTVRGQVESGGLRAIGVTSPQRFPSVPQIPTLAESGLPGYNVTSWYGLALPAGTPAPIVGKMTTALHVSLARDAIRQQIAKSGALPKSSTPEELQRHIASEIAKWERVRAAAGIQKQ